MGIVKHIPNTITSMNLLCGVMGVIFTIEGRPDIAFTLMIAAAVFDFCDGLAARLLGAYSNIGKELDSLADMVSFGVLPSVMLLQAMGPQPYRYICLFLAAMSALRLAKFNVDERQESDFLGVATPTSAMICGSLCYLIYSGSAPWLQDLAVSHWFLPVVAMVLGLLLVSEIPMFGMKIKKGHKLLDAKRIVFLFLVVAAIVVTIVLGLNWSFAVLAIFVGYILENLVLAVTAH